MMETPPKVFAVVLVFMTLGSLYACRLTTDHGTSQIHQASPQAVAVNTENPGANPVPGSTNVEAGSYNKGLDARNLETREGVYSKDKGITNEEAGGYNTEHFLRKTDTLQNLPREQPINFYEQQFATMDYDVISTTHQKDNYVYLLQKRASQNGNQPTGNETSQRYRVTLLKPADQRVVLRVEVKPLTSNAAPAPQSPSG